MLILLTHANHLYSDAKQVRKMQPYPPLQALLAASMLRSRGHEVALFDTTFDRGVAAAMDEVRPDLVAVCEDNFNFLTKMCLLENRELAFEIAREARRRGIPAVVNSSDATSSPEAYLAAGFDRVILGELEETIAALVAAWPETVPGVFGGAPRAAIADLDTLPMPAWDLVDIERYRSAWMGAHGFFSLNLNASRGCPYHCNWCAKPIHGDAYRAYSAARVAAEIELVRERFAPDQIWFTDDIFGLSRKWLAELAARIERPVPFKIQSRADLMTAATVEALARAGCFEVWMGAESGSQRVLDAMEKGLRVQQIDEARRTLRDHGVRACLFLQFGYIGEEWSDIEQTIDMVRRVRPDDIGVSVSYPMPGTRFHQIVHPQMPGAAHWRESGDLAMMYSGAFSSDLYRALAEALHLEVRGEAAGSVSDAWNKVEHLRCACC